MGNQEACLGEYNSLFTSGTTGLAAAAAAGVASTFGNKTLSITCIIPVYIEKYYIIDKLYSITSITQIIIIIIIIIITNNNNNNNNNK
jgi:glycerol-3-phosphate acyltransferase PlsY